jgi:hypothetical protein
LSSDSGAPAGLSEVRWTRTTVGGPNDLGGSVTFTVHCILLQTTVGADSRCFAGTQDSPVNYNGVSPQILEASKFELIHPTTLVHQTLSGGASDTVRCARPRQPSVVFCSFYLNPFMDFLLVCVEPLAPVELII